MRASCKSHVFGTVAAMAAAAWLLCGCGNPAASPDLRDENHPLMRRAQALRRANDMPGAIKAYKTALEKKPSLARAHFELGALYDRPDGDYVQAIHHYTRYLEARPNTEKKDLVSELIRRARISYATTLPEKPSESIRMIAEMQSELAGLKQQVEGLQGQLTSGQLRIRQLEQALTENRIPVPPVLETAAPPSRPPAAGGATAAAAQGAASATGTTNRSARGGTLPRPAPVPAPAAVEVYEVQPGDTLSVIAGRVYKDRNAWRRIYDANRDQLPDTGSIRPGQKLKIPR